MLPVVHHLSDLPIRWIIAPHEIHEKHIDQWIEYHPDRMDKYSQIDYLEPKKDILWIDNVGMLNRLYHYADLAYIGGGFGSGIHNTQEPTAYGVPVAFGPKYHKFKEAVDLVGMECAFSFTRQTAFLEFIKRFYEDRALLAETSARTAAYIREQAGATALITAALEARGGEDP